MDAPKMTRRHFDFIAWMLRDIQPDHSDGMGTTTWRSQCDSFAYWLAATNPNFDRELFLAACEGPVH